jgi:ketohexokinase
VIKDSLPGVDFSHCIYREESREAASSYIIRSEENGSRTIVNYNGLPEMTFDEFKDVANAVKETGAGEEDWWHFEVRLNHCTDDLIVWNYPKSAHLFDQGRIPDVTLECIRYLRKSASTNSISVEVEKPGRPGLEDLAAEADGVFYSRSWAQAKGYNNATECLRAQSRVMNVKE